MGNAKKPLEWTGYGRLVAATDATPVNGRFSLGLRDDEIAEIHKLVWRMELLLVATTTGARVDVLMSMDPDTSQSALTAANNADLEVFNTDSFVLNPLQLIADVDEIYPGVKNEDLDFKIPILVGTDVGITTQFTWLTADGTGNVFAKIFFTRRKATAMELNQILLKRR